MKSYWLFGIVFLGICSICIYNYRNVKDYLVYFICKAVPYEEKKLYSKSYLNRKEIYGSNVKRVLKRMAKVSVKTVA